VHRQTAPTKRTTQRRRKQKWKWRRRRKKTKQRRKRKRKWWKTKKKWERTPALRWATHERPAQREKWVRSRECRHHRL
jgi:hypothetical protein